MATSGTLHEGATALVSRHVPRPTGPDYRAALLAGQGAARVAVRVPLDPAVRRVRSVAVDTGQSRRWQDPAFLEAAAKVAARVTIGWGETQSQDLRPIVIK